jgi:hypothetical protein
MAIGGFLQGLGLAYGRDLIYGQQFDQNQAKTQLMQAEAQQANLQTQQMQQQIQTQKTIGAFIQSQTQLEDADASLPANQAKLYAKAGGMAMAMGDFASAKTFDDLSKQATQDAIEQQKQLALQQQQKKEALANAADALPANPTRDEVNDIVKKAVDAGVNPGTIPLTNTADFKTWVNDQKLAGMDSAKKAEFIQKAAEMKANRDQKWQEHEDNVNMERARAAQTAAYQNAILSLKESEATDRANRDPKIITVGSDQYEFDASGSLKGDRLATDPRFVKIGTKTSPQQQRDQQGIIRSSAQATRDLHQMGNFDIGTTASPFLHMTDHDFTTALGKAATNVITPEQVQMFQSSSAGLVKQIDRAETLGGGRASTQSQLNELHNQISPASGDTNLEAAYKISTGAQILKTALQNIPKVSDPDLEKSREAQIAELDRYPTPEQILKASKGPLSAKLKSLQGNYNDLLDSVQQGGQGLPDRWDNSSSSSGGIPAGWSVKEH